MKLKRRLYRKSKARPSDPVFGQGVLLDLANKCKHHEAIKPLRWQGRREYLKEIYNPDE